MFYSSVVDNISAALQFFIRMMFVTYFTFNSKRGHTVILITLMVWPHFPDLSINCLVCKTWEELNWPIVSQRPQLCFQMLFCPNIKCIQFTICMEQQRLINISLSQSQRKYKLIKFSQFSSKNVDTCWFQFHKWAD